MSRKKWTDDKLFHRLLHNRTNEAYWNNIRELHRRGTKEVFYMGYKLALSKVNKEKLIGIDVLAQIDFHYGSYNKQKLDLYFELLKKEKDSKVLWSTLYAIGHNNGKLTSSHIKILNSFINNNDIEIRQGLVYSLLAVENQKAIDALILLSSDRIASIRDWATFGLGTQIDRNNKKIRDALWKRVADKDQNTKEEAIFGLAKRKDVEIKLILKKELLEGQFGMLLFDAIEELNDMYLLSLLEKNIKVYKQNNTSLDWYITYLTKSIKELKIKNKKTNK